MTTPLKALLVGCGSISRAWLNGCKTIAGLEIVGLVDLVSEAAQNRAEEFGLTEALIETDLASALQTAQPDIVFNCTIPEAHLDVSLAGLAHGCHVLSEKPLADSMASAREIVAAADQAGRLFAVIQNRRFNPNIRRLSRFLRQGGLGPLTTVNSDFYLGAHFGGFRDRMEHVLLLDMAIHTFDQARLICGADPVSVYCREWNPAGSWYDHDASAIAVFEMENGLVYTYRGSWCAEGVNTSWDADWRVVGRNGSASWDGETTFQAEIVAETGGFRSELAEVEIPPLDSADPVALSTGQGHSGLIADFVACVRTGRTPETVGHDNIKSLAMVFGAIESAQKGGPVSID